jgi:trehalose 6-phosphate synthase
MTAALVVASNRGPITFDEDGMPRRGSGGLVPALRGALAHTKATWIAAAISPGDRARSGMVADAVEGASVRLLDIPPEEFGPYYNRLANRVLWFVHHYLFDAPRTPVYDQADDEAWDAYRSVNRRFAEAIAEEAAEGATVLVQDYHLAVVPPMLRALRPDVAIGHFWHIPFAGPDYLRLLPDSWNRELMEGLLGADLVGLQTKRWASAFAACARSTLGASASERRVVRDERTVKIGVFPIGVNPDDLAEAAASPDVRAAREALKRWLGDRTLVLRVDRTELSKNVLRGLLAYEELLSRRPDLAERIVHLALLQPSRHDVPEYRVYTEECVALAARIEERFGPDVLRLEISDDYARTLAAYTLYDVLVVNPVFDGMNLVAREGPVLNRRDGVLVLSRNAGAFEELGSAAIGVNPFDVAETTAAIATAVDLPASERKERAKRLRRAARGKTPGRWLDAQLKALR